MPAEPAEPAPTPVPGADPAPRIGGYVLGERLGEGGMGIVWAAVQESPRREVALKVVRPGPGFAEHRRRFEYEAEVLGWLNHPAIAQIYEAGVAETPSGPQPYFAMERVHGEALDTHLARRRTTLRERLELFVAICEGVQHAHHRGVIHRDLKPGNLLVQEDGRPKVLDFGVARAVDLEDEATALRTATGELVGTLAYMSPEQVRADPAGVDVRADVYALGLVLYEMVAGRRAFDLAGRPLPEAMRAVLDDAPPRLSAVAPGTPTDLETIVAKATEKDPARRYDSVEELAADVRRFLSDVPIRARPPSTIYHVTKFVRRNRLLVTSLAVVFGLLTAGVGVSSNLYVREQRAREQSEGDLREARLRLRRLLETNRTFEGLLVSPFPDQEGRDVRMVDVLQHAAHEARGEFPDDPLQRAWLMRSLGQNFLALRLPEEGLPLLEEALAAMLETAAADPDDELERVSRATLRTLAAQALTDLRRFDEALAQLDLAAEEGRGLTGANAALVRHDVEFGRAHLKSSRGLPEDAAQVLGHLERSLEALEDSGADRPRDRCSVWMARATHHVRQGEPAEAEAAAREALALLEEDDLGHTDDAALLHNTLGGVLYQQGRPDEAVEHLRTAIDLATAAFGSDHETLAIQRNNLGTLLRSVGRIGEARAEYEESRAILERLGRSPSLPLARTLVNLGTMDLSGDTFEAGEAQLLAAEAMLDELGGEELDLDRAWISTYLVRAYTDQERFEDALARSDRALAMKEALYGPEHLFLIGDLTNRGRLQLAMDDPAAAVATFERGQAIVLASQGPGSRDAFLYRRLLCDGLGRLGRWEEARDVLAPGAEWVERTFAPDAWERDDLAADLAWCDAHRGVPDARARLAEAVAAMAGKVSAGHGRLGEHRRRLEELER